MVGIATLSRLYFVLGGRWQPCLWLGMLDVLLQPRVLLGEDVQDALPRPVKVALVGKQAEAGLATQAFDRRKQALALHRVCARVRIRLRVYQEEGRLDLIGVVEGAHRAVRLAGLPKVALCEAYQEHTR